MSHIEGDGVIEDIYYLLWRKDSPYNEKLNLRIPDTVIFRNGRPMAWYYTNNEGAVMRKKQTSLVYPEILKKFTKGATEGEIVAYFVNIDHEKKLGRLLDKNYYKHPSADDSNNDDDTPCHDVEYFGLNDFTDLFSDYKKFEGKTGILQRFIHPYGSNNELIQAIWSPRVCVFTKRVNLRRLNETRFDIYERALTFDGPDFYSKNVPLRGGYIPGKLRATCDNIVRHVAFISFEKVSINRLVGYFKVDQNENVWFLWTSSIRVGETSKAHKRISQFIDKPLCLEPCMQTSTNIRHIKSNFSTRPVTLRMTEQCSVCAVKVSTISLIPVAYRLLLGNEAILKRSEKLASKLRVIRTTKDIEENNGPKLKSPKKQQSTIGVPYFIKKLHPEMTLKAFQNLKEKEHFLIMKTSVCEECYLIVSQEYEGGFPCSLNEAHDRRGLKSARTSGRRMSSVIDESGNRKERSATPEKPSVYESGEGFDTVKENDSRRASAHLYMTSVTNRRTSADTKTLNSQRLQISPEPVHPNGAKVGSASTTYGTLASNRSSDFPKFLNRTLWAKPAKGLNKVEQESGFSNLEETKFDSAQQDHSNLKRDLIKAFSGVFDGTSKGHGRSINSMSKISLGQSMNKVGSDKKPSRPQTSAIESTNKKGRIIKSKQGGKKQTLSQYKLDEVPDLFNDSDSSDDMGIHKFNALSHRPPTTYQTPRELQRKTSTGTPGIRPLSTECPDNPDSVRVVAGVGKGRNKLKGYLAEINPEVKIQEHLDQDIIFTMANANKRKENIPILKAQPPSMLKDKKSPYNSSYSHREYSQDATGYQSPHNQFAPSGRSTKIKTKGQSVIHGNEVGNDIGNIVDKYYEESMV